MRVALVSVLGLLIACGGDDAITIAANQDNFCEQISDVICHNLYQCCTESEIENRLGVSDPRTENQCREDYQRACERRAPDVRDSLKAGRITFDATRLNDCLNAVVAPADSCSAIVMTDYPWTEACKTAPWVGTVQTTGSCFFDFDCAGSPDSFCGPDQKCKMKPTAGFPCGTGCASAYYCASNGTCAAKLQVGAPCTSQPNNQCDKNLFCDQTATPMPVCATKQGGGAACTTSLGCLSNDCVPGQCNGTTFGCYTDAQCQSRCAGTGTSCQTASDCGNGNCSVSGTTCNQFTTCSGGTSDVCVFPRQCLPGDCVGDPVCTSQTLTVDYCTAISNVPQP